MRRPMAGFAGYAEKFSGGFGFLMHTNDGVPLRENAPDLGDRGWSHLACRLYSGPDCPHIGRSAFGNWSTTQ